MEGHEEEAMPTPEAVEVGAEKGEEKKEGEGFFTPELLKTFTEAYEGAKGKEDSPAVSAIEATIKKEISAGLAPEMQMAMEGVEVALDEAKKVIHGDNMKSRLELLMDASDAISGSVGLDGAVPLRKGIYKVVPEAIANARDAEGITSSVKAFVNTMVDDFPPYIIESGKRSIAGTAKIAKTLI